jgi:hypothetical protein
VGEDDIDHLCECSLGGGLVDEVTAGQVDVVTGTHCQQNRSLVDLNVRGGDCRQQSLQENREGSERGMHNSGNSPPQKSLIFLKSWFEVSQNQKGIRRLICNPPTRISRKPGNLLKSSQNSLVHTDREQRINNVFNYLCEL